MTFEWKKEYETGVPQIDDDHRQLIEQLNVLSATMQKGTAMQEIPKLLNFLEAYARQHFAREEACMMHYRCPAAAQNKAAHKEFIAHFGNAKKQLMSKGVTLSVALKIHKDLCTWIRKHILTVDVNLRGCKR